MPLLLCQEITCMCWTCWWFKLQERWPQIHSWRRVMHAWPNEHVGDHVLPCMSHIPVHVFRLASYVCIRIQPQCPMCGGNIAILILLIALAYVAISIVYCTKRCYLHARRQHTHVWHAHLYRCVYLHAWCSSKSSTTTSVPTESGSVWTEATSKSLAKGNMHRDAFHMVSLDLSGWNSYACVNVKKKEGERGPAVSCWRI